VLWVCHLPHSGRFRALLAALWAIFAAPQSNTPLVFTTKEVLIETRKRHVDVALDGEVIAMQAPLRYRIRPDALRVITPAAAS
jgi:diacylglycerol kinase family enzyme